MNLYIFSFGFKYQTPPEAQFVFDVRRLRNPYYVPTLKAKNGQHPHVRGYVLQNQLSQDTVDAMVRFLETVLPGTKPSTPGSDIAIAVGCTGGFHRSVAVAEELRDRLVRRHKLFSVTVGHRDLGRHK